MSALTTPASHARDAHDGAGSTGASPSGGRHPRRSATDAGRAPLWMVSPAGLVMILVIGLPIVFLVLTLGALADGLFFGLGGFSGGHALPFSVICQVHI